MLRRLLLHARCIALAALPLLAACEDGGTAPTSYVQVVGGGAWVAVVEPAGMPRAETWLPWLPAESPAWEEVRAFHEAAARARRAGRIEESLALEDDALRTAAAALPRAPDPARGVLGPLAALDAWTERARARLQSGSYPELQAAADEVAGQAAAARRALSAGDTLQAVAHLASGTVAARRQAPVAVGLRLMGAVQARLGRPQGGESPNVRRARRLLAGAREGLATGDELRAMRRAMYALQLLETEGTDIPPPR